MKNKPSIINCHTHIFTGDYVPPYLAKVFLPWPLYYFVPIYFFVNIMRLWYDYPNTWMHKPWFKWIKQKIYVIRMIGLRTGLGRILGIVIGALLGIQVFYILYDWMTAIGLQTDYATKITSWRDWLNSHQLLCPSETIFVKIIILVIFLTFFETGKNLLFFIVKKVWSFLRILPGSNSQKLFERYLNIVRFALHRTQDKVLLQLKNQYPEGTGFVILPMDMEFMDAGKLSCDIDYKKQMEDIKKIKESDTYKNIIFPFVFIDPRRIHKEGKQHLDYDIEKGKVTLKNCFIKEYIEDNKFNGFKIYPALGYYPFEENLLPLWKYAADNGLPILTHCIKGTIFFRGNKKKAWDQHPVFEQVVNRGKYGPLQLLETKNIDFINNFTHPLNYLCLLEERLLRKLVGNSNNEIKKLFGYSNEDTRLEYDLSHLKLCFGHFGGDDEWKKFMELDRDNHSSQLIKYPEKGITFLENDKAEYKQGKPEQIWKYCDWYSIICSMMLQYPNVYADLSYIIHNPDIQPLLNQTLKNDILKKKVLFGTDFYVVRNHKSEKNMFADITNNLSEAEVDLIARLNPRDFLSSQLHGRIPF